MKPIKAWGLLVKSTGKILSQEVIWGDAVLPVILATQKQARQYQRSNCAKNKTSITKVEIVFKP